ncbi:MAG: RND family transporter [Acidobacteriota bacterium]
MIRFLLAHRLAAAVLLVATTVLLGSSAATLQVDPGVESMMPAGGSDMRRLRRFNETFGADEVIVVALHGPAIFSQRGLAVMKDLTDKIAALPHVLRVLSPVNARDIDGDEMGPFPLVPYQKVQDGSISPAQLGTLLAAHPLYGGLLVSRDAHTAALLADVARAEENATYRRRLVSQVRRLAASVTDGLEVRVAGIPVEKVDVAESINRDQKVLVPLIFLIMALVMTLLYRHPVGVIVPLGVMSTSVIWTLGLYTLAGRLLNPVTSLLAPVVMIVSLAGAVHFLNHHLVARESGLGREEALERAYRRVRMPCFNAALTTAIGFGSLVLLPIPAIRTFGLFTAVGVMVSYLLTMVLVPIMLRSLPHLPPRIIRPFHPGRVKHVLAAIGRGVGRHPRLTALLALGVIGLGLAGLTRLRVETDLLHALKHGSPLYEATRFIDRNLTGVNSLEILVDEVDADDPAALSRVDRLARAIRALPGIRKVASLPDLYSRVNRAMHGGDDAFNVLPQGPTAKADIRDMHEMLQEEAPAELARCVAGDGRSLCLSARVTALDSAASQELFGEIHKAAQDAGLAHVSLTGNFAVLSDLSTSLVHHQLRGLVPALVLILLAMIGQFRSIRLGVLAIVPSVVPVLLVYGLMGWIGITLSVPTAMIASIGLGMTVDNTIHLTAGFRAAAHEGADEMSALTAMMDGSGRAVVFATLTVALGFGVGLFSSFLPTIHFAVLTGAALILGLICVVVLLPLLLVVFKPLGHLSRPGRAAITGALLVGVLVAGPVLAAAVQTRTARGSSALMTDQFGDEDGIEAHHGDVIVLLHGTALDLRRMKNWENRLLGDADADVTVLRAIDARPLMGKKTDAEVRHRLKLRVPDRIRILVDWKGTLQTRYQLPDEGVSVSVFDRDASLCTTLSGPVSDAGLASARAVLSAVSADGHCPAD